MTDKRASVTPIRPDSKSSYGDTDAMNDIQALITSQDVPNADEVAALVTEIVARTGRPLARARVITAEVSCDRYGMPVALVEAGGTTVSAGQDPHGPGVLIEVTASGPGEADALVVSVNGRVQRLSPCPAPVSRAGTPASRETPGLTAPARRGRDGDAP
jgi:hypothetical protein